MARLYKCSIISNLQSLFLCLGRDSNPYSPFGPRDFLTAMTFVTGYAVCSLDYSFTVDFSLGVSCLVSAPSFFQRLGSRLPSALPVKASLNLRHSTSLLSERALNLALYTRALLSPSCLPFHHQGKCVSAADSFGIANIQIFSEVGVVSCAPVAPANPGSPRRGLRC